MARSLAGVIRRQASRLALVDRFVRCAVLQPSQADRGWTRMGGCGILDGLRRVYGEAIQVDSKGSVT